MKKDYFNLEDVAKQLMCEVGDLLHYAAQGRLNLSVLLAGEKATLHIWDSNPIENDNAIDITEADEFIRDARIVEELFGPFPLPLRSAKKLEAGRLHEINGVRDRVTKEDYSEWSLLKPLKSTDIKIVVEAEDFLRFKPHVLTNDTGVKPRWQKTAREIGVEWMNAEEQKTHRRPSVADIAKYVEGELSTRNITGVRGKFPDWETIKREALTGITGRKKGENLKRGRRNPHLK